MTTTVTTAAGTNQDIGDLLKGLAQALISEIPYIGGIGAAILGFFWPQNKPDIWSLIKDKVQDLIDASILKHELQERIVDLESLKTHIKDYIEESNAVIRKDTLLYILRKAIDVRDRLLSPQVQNRMHFLPLSFTVGFLHIGMLAERAKWGKELFNDSLIDAERARKAVRDAIEYYCFTTYDVHVQWIAWREQKISYNVVEGYLPIGSSKMKKVTLGAIRDSFNNRSWTYDINGWNAPYLSGIMAGKKQEWRTEYDLAMDAYAAPLWELFAYGVPVYPPSVLGHSEADVPPEFRFPKVTFSHRLRSSIVKVDSFEWRREPEIDKSLLVETTDESEQAK